jgi:integrase
MQRKKPDRITLDGVSATVVTGRVDELGRAYWRARGPSPQRLTLWTGWATREEVVAVVADLVQKGRHKSSPSSGGSAGPVRTTGELLRRWLGHQERRHAAGELADMSLKNYRRAVAHWLAVLDELAPAAISRARVEDVATSWRAAGVSARSCRLAVDVLATAWRWGEDRELVSRLDFSRLQLAEARDDEHVYAAYTPTRSEADEVIAAVPPGRDQNLIRLLAWTGARVGEVGALTVGSVDLELGILSISGRDRARGRRGKVATRRWPIGGELEVLLRRLVEGRGRDEPLLVDLPTNVSTLARHLLLTACAFAEVPRFTAHGLRRLVTMELLEEGDAKSVSLLTGHSVAVLLRDYVRPRAESLRDLVARAGVGSPRKVIRLDRAQKAGTTPRK